MRPINEMKMELPSRSCNEGFARTAVAAFVAQLDPAVDEVADIRTAVSEAVTNCIVHAYRGTEGLIYITVMLPDAHTVRVAVRDKGCGIADVQRAREPLFTTDAAGERSGMGFTVMENFMDKLSVHSHEGVGTVVIMTKRIGRRREE